LQWFSSRKNTMTSAYPRWSHPPNAAISNWNGSTVEVYAMHLIDLWDTDSSGATGWRPAAVPGFAGLYLPLVTERG
jgi:hypothetical protein